MNIFEAAQKGDINEVKKQIASGEDVNAKGEHCSTVLMYALESGNIELCKWLVEEKGADVNAAYECAEYLDYDEDICGDRFEYSYYAFKETALSYAINNGKTDIVHFLINHNVDINATGNDGETALMLAAEKENTDVVKLLIEKGADINIKDYKGETALLYAVKNKNLDILKLLIENGADVNAETNETALMRAAKNGNIISAKYLVAHGANINAFDSKCSSALMYAVKSGNIELCRWLIEENKANVNDIEHFEYTEIDTFSGNEKYYDYTEYDLICAAKLNYWDITKLLIEHNAKIDLRDDDGETVLMYAVRAKKWDIVSFLIERGANIKAKNKNSKTVLMYAAESGNLELCKELVNIKGLNIFLRDKKGQTVLTYAVKSENNDLCQWLVKEKMADINAEWEDISVIEAFKNGNIKACHNLIDSSFSENISKYDDVPF